MTARSNDENNGIDPMIANRLTVDNPLLETIDDPNTKQIYRKMTFAEKTLMNHSLDCIVCTVKPLNYN